MQTIGGIRFELQLDRSKLDRDLAAVKRMSSKLKLDIDTSSLKAISAKPLKVGLEANSLIVRLSKTPVVKVRADLDVSLLSKQLADISRKQSVVRLLAEIDTSSIESQLKSISSRQVKVKVAVDGAGVIDSLTSKHKVKIDAEGLEKSLAESVEKGTRKAQHKGLFKSVASIPGNFASSILRGYQEGIGITYSQKMTSGFLRGLEKDFNISLSRIGEKSAAMFARVGRDAGDRALRRLGLEDGLAALAPKLDQIRHGFSTLIDTQELDRRFATLEGHVGKLIDSLTTLKGVATQVENITNVAASVKDIAMLPAEGAAKKVAERRAATFQESFKKAQARAAQMTASKYEGADTAIVSIGGFAGTRGASGQAVGSRMQVLAGQQNPVIPIDNTATDLTVNVSAGAEFFKQALAKMFHQNVVKPGNEDAINAVAHALAIKQANPDLPVNFAGYSAGGFVAQEAVEIMKAGGHQAKGVGIGTPRFGVSATTTPDEFVAVMGEGDPLAKPTRLSGAKDALFVKQGGKAHKLESYLGTKDSQDIIRKQLGLKGAATDAQMGRAPYALQGYEEELNQLAGELGSVLSDQRQTMFFKKTGLYKTYIEQIKKHREKLSDLLSDSAGEIAKQIEAYDEALAEAETLVKSVFGVQGEVAPAIKAKVSESVPQQQKATPPPTVDNASKPRPQITNPVERANSASFKASYARAVDEIARSAGLALGSNQRPTVKAANLPKGANAAYQSQSNAVLLSKEQLQLISTAIPKKVEELAPADITPLIKNLSSVVHEVYHGAQYGFSGKAKTELDSIKAPQVKVTEQERKNFAAIRGGQTIEQGVQGSVSGMQASKAFQTLSEEEKKAAIAMSKSMEQGAYAVQAKFITEFAKQLKLAQGQADVTVAQVFEQSVAAVAKQVETARLEVPTANAVKPAPQIKSATDQLKGFNTEVLKEVGRTAGLGTIKGDKSELLKQLGGLSPESLAEAIAAVKPLIQVGPQGGQSIKKVPQSTKEKELIGKLIEAEKKINYLYQAFNDAEGERRARIASALELQLEDSIGLISAMQKRQISSEGRMEIGGQKGRLNSIKTNIAKTIDSPARPKASSQSLQESKGSVPEAATITTTTEEPKVSTPNQGKAQPKAEKSIEIRSVYLPGDVKPLQTQLAAIKKQLVNGLVIKSKYQAGDYKELAEQFAALKKVLGRGFEIKATYVAGDYKILETQFVALRKKLSEGLTVGAVFRAGKTEELQAQLLKIKEQLAPGFTINSRFAKADQSELEAQLEKAKIEFAKGLTITVKMALSSESIAELKKEAQQVKASVQQTAPVRQGDNLKGYTTEILKEIARVSGASTKGTKAELLQSLGSLDPKVLAKAVAGVKPRIEVGPKGGQTLKKAAQPKSEASVDDTDVAGMLGQFDNIQLARVAAPKKLNAQKVYEAIAHETAKISGVLLDPKNIPQLKVDDAKLKQMGAAAFYSIKENQIIISQELSNLLGSDLNTLESAQEEIKNIVHEMRHALQFKFGKSSIAKQAVGLDTPGVDLISPEYASRDAKYNAARSAQVANQQASGLLPKPIQKQIAATELDAYAFEKVATPHILARSVSALKENAAIPSVSKEEGQLRKIFDSGRAVGREFEKVASTGVGTFFGVLDKGIEKVLPGVSQLGVKAKDLVLGFVGFQFAQQGLQIIQQFGQEALTASIKFDALKTALNFASGGSANAEGNLKFIDKTVADLKIPLAAAQQGFTKLAGATRGTAAEGQATRDVFLGMSQAATVLGLTTDQTNNAFLALSQMASKGTLSSEELKGQLAESGLAGAFGIAARAMGVTEQQLNKMLEQGLIPASEFLPKFGKQLQQEFGGSAVDASNNAQSALFNLENQFLKLQQTVGAAIQPVVTLLANTMAPMVAGLASVNLGDLGLGILLPVLAQSTPMLKLFAGAAGFVSGLTMETAIAGFTKLKGVVASALIQFLAVQAGIEAIRTIFDAIVPDDSTKQIQSFADSAVNNLQKVTDAANEAAGAIAKVQPKDANKRNSQGFDVGGVLTMGMASYKTDDIVNAINDAKKSPLGDLAGGVANALGVGGLASAAGSLNLQTIGEKKANDQMLAVSNLGSAIDQSLQNALQGGVYAQRLNVKGEVMKDEKGNPLKGEFVSFKSQLEATASADSKVAALQRQKSIAQAAATPDKNAIAAIDKQIAEENAKKEKASKVVLQDAADRTAQRDSVTKAKGIVQANLDKGDISLNDYNAQISVLDAKLKSLDQADAVMNNLQQSIKTSTSAALDLAVAFSGIAASLDEASRKSERLFNKDQLRIAKQQVGEFGTNALSSQSSANLQAMAEVDKAKRDAEDNQKAISEMGKQFNTDAAQSMLAGIGVGATGKGITLDSSLTQIEEAKKGLGDKDGDKKAVLDRLKIYKEGLDKQIELDKQFQSATLAAKKAREAMALAEMEQRTLNRESGLKRASNTRAVDRLKGQLGEFGNKDAAGSFARGLNTDVLSSRSSQIDTLNQTRSVKAQLAEIQKLKEDGVISAEEYTKRERDLTNQLSDLKVQAAEKELAVKEAMQKKALGLIEREATDRENKTKRGEIAATLGIKRSQMGLATARATFAITPEDAAVKEAGIGVRQADAAAKAAKERVASIQAEIQALGQAYQSGDINADEFYERNQDLTNQLGDARIRVADAGLSAEEARARFIEANNAKIIASLEFANKKAEAAIQLSQTTRATGIKASYGFGGVSDAQTGRAIDQVEVDAINQKIALRSLELNQNRQLVAEKRRGAKEGTETELRLQQELADLNSQRVDKEINLQRQLRDSYRANQDDRLNYFSKLKSLEQESLDRSKQLLDAAQSLAQAQSEASISGSNAKLATVDKAIQLRDTISDPNADPTKRKAAREALDMLGISSSEDEMQLLEEKQRIEDEIANKKALALAAEMGYQRQSLEIEIQKNKLAAENLQIEAQKAKLQAQRNSIQADKDYQAAAARGDKAGMQLALDQKAMAARESDLADRQALAADKNLAAQEKMAAMQRGALGAKQQGQLVDAISGEKMREVDQQLALGDTASKLGRQLPFGQMAAAGGILQNTLNNPLGATNNIAPYTPASLIQQDKANAEFANRLSGMTGGIQPTGEGLNSNALIESTNRISDRIDALNGAIMALANKPRSLSITATDPAETYADFQNKMVGNDLRNL